MLILAVLFVSNLINAQFGGFGMGMGYMGPPPMQNFPKEGVAEHQMQIAQIFPDSLDSKPLGEFIAAGMLPRYAPIHTDGYDAGDMWMAGMHGETEDQVIAQAKMKYPRSARLGAPEDAELNPLWAQVVAAGLNRRPGQPAPQAGGPNFAPGGDPAVGGPSGPFNNFQSGPNGFQFNGGFVGGEQPEQPERPEMGEAPEGYNNFNSFSGPTNAGSGAGSGSGSFPNFNAGLHPAVMEEHGEDICPTLSPQDCHYPCMSFGGFCTGEMALRKFHAHLQATHAQESSPKGFHLTHLQILYSAWGLTTGLVVGLLFEYRRRRKTNPEVTDAFHAMA